MIFAKIKNNLLDPAYYFSQILGLLSSSFLIILWLYLSKLKLVQLSNIQIILYFISIYSYFYLFTYSLIDRLAARLATGSQSFLLSPKSVYTTLFVKDYLPILVDNIPLIFLSLLLVIFTGVLPLNKLIYFIFLQFTVHLIYFFTSVIGAIFQLLLNWGFISFSFRFIGQTWNGSYIPLIFLSGGFLSFALFLPIFYSGIPFQLLLVQDLDYRLIINLFVFLFISFTMSYLLLARFKTHVQE